MAANRYFVCYSYAPGPEPIDIAGPAPDIPEYHRDLLRVLERELPDTGLTIYLTWKLDVLPSTGSDVVAVVMGDEWSRTPLYAQDVLATFKVYGDRPILGFRLLGRPTWIKALLAAKYVRATAHGLKGRVRRTLARLHRAQPPIIPIPLGFGNQAEMPVRPLGARGTDVFFAGSVEHHGEHGRLSPRYWLRSPKTLAREQMLDALARLEATRPDITVRTSTTASFTLNAIYYGTEDGADALAVDAYSAAMMDAKICLVPRGTNPETFRYFEALRYGCVAIVERQPGFPFYAGAPVVEIDDWRRLDELLPELLADTERMDRLHREGPAWWRDRCSAEAIGSMMVRTIRELRPGASGVGRG